MKKEIFVLINKLLNIIFLLLVGYFMIEYSHTLEGPLKQFTAFTLGVAAMAQAIVPIFAIIKSDDTSIKKDD